MVAEIHVIELLPEYVLEMLDEQDQRRVKAHLNACSSCQAELRSYQQVTAQLSLAAPEIPPPPGLKRRLMSRLEISAPAPVAGHTTWWQRLFGPVCSFAPRWDSPGLYLW